MLYPNNTHFLTEANPIAGCFPVDPEGHPRKNDDQDAGYIHLDQEVAGASGQVEVDSQGGVHAWRNNVPRRSWIK